MGTNWKKERNGINSSTNEKFDSAIIIAYRLILFSRFFTFSSFSSPSIIKITDENLYRNLLYTLAIVSQTGIRIQE